MSSMVKIASRLGIICAVAAIVLAMVNSVTAPRIEAYQQMVIQRALDEVSAGYTTGTQQIAEADGVEYFVPLTDSNGNTAGFVLSLIASGYGGPMNIMASFSSEGQVLQAKLLQNSETPGLGKKAESPGYMEKFLGTGDSGPVPTRKSDLSAPDADSISGATITFSGVAKALAVGSDYAKILGGTL